MRKNFLIVSILASSLLAACGTNNSSFVDGSVESTISEINNTESTAVVADNSFLVDSIINDATAESNSIEGSDEDDGGIQKDDVPSVDANEIVLERSLFSYDWRETPYSVTIPDVDDSIKYITIRSGRFNIRDSGGISYDVTTYEGLRGHGLFKIEMYGDEESPLDSDNFKGALATILVRAKLGDEEVISQAVELLYINGVSKYENIEMQLDKEKNTFLLVNIIALPNETIMENDAMFN